MQDDRFLKSVLDEKREYGRVIQSLSPCDVPCIYCGHSRTHEHGCYEREPQITDVERGKFRPLRSIDNT